MENYTPPEGSDEPATTGRKKKERTGPKRPLTSYMFFCQDVRSQVREDNPDMKATDVTREMGKMWKALSDDEKVLFQEQAAKDKERYHQECEEQGLRTGKKAAPKKKAAAKAAPKKKAAAKAAPKKKATRKKTVAVAEIEPEIVSDSEEEEEEVKVAPPPKRKGRKQRLTGYILFCQENRPSVKEDNPKWKAPQVTKQLSKQWKALDDEDRDEYNDRAHAGETATK
jgi:hypothetical protein